VESLSPYARQFLGMMGQPDVDSIEGLSPAISIDQKTTSRNPRSTVGTVTEIYDYLRLLYARVGEPHCPVCMKLISSQGSDQIVNSIKSLWAGKKVSISYPIARGEKGTYDDELKKLKNLGLYKISVDGKEEDLSAGIPKLDKNKKHTILVNVDSLTCGKENHGRLSEAVETALKENGILIAKCETEERMFSSKNACPEHNISLGELQPRDFSFNAPFGACPECHGLGFKMEFSPDLIIPDRSVSIMDGAIVCYKRIMEGSWRLQQIMSVARENGIRMDVPVSEIPKEKLDVLLYGTDKTMKFTYESKTRNSTYEYNSVFEGVIPQLERLFHQTASEMRKEEIGKFMRELQCPTCKGNRLKPEILSVLVGGKGIMEICGLPITQARTHLASTKFGENSRKISAPILKEINSRLEFLENVGLDYLNLGRESGTLSGGESQRIRLATQIGSNLTGVLYVLDEPSIGLHQKDNEKLLVTLKRLRDMGNTLVVVEHDEETMRECDHLVDMGPGAGIHGGRVVAEGGVEDLIKAPESLTGAYLSGKKSIPVPKARRKPVGALKIIGARGNNLKNIDVELPLGVLTCITGVSGSGKSTLVSETLHPRLANFFNGSALECAPCTRIDGMGKLDRAIVVDQSPIGRTPRSNPATYVGMFTAIRDLFAKIPESRSRGYGPGRFSFNVEGGRCQNCEGDGLIKISMHFLADVYVECEICRGKRYNSQTLEVKYKGKSISDVLEMDIEEASKFFESLPAISSKLKTLNDVGLGYMKLGQPATTLSGGEAQRVKLATELSKRASGMTMYLLDEPTTGLHFDDVKKLLDVLARLVDKGNTVVIIEHNLDVIKSADWVIDLGPDGGDAGGKVMAQGTPEEVAKSGTHTGEYLGRALSGGKNGV
jgi:excinuclease ABC subunit A